MTVEELMELKRKADAIAEIEKTEGYIAAREFQV